MYKNFNVFICCNTLEVCCIKSSIKCQTEKSMRQVKRWRTNHTYGDFHNDMNSIFSLLWLISHHQNKQYTEIISTIVSFKNFLKSPNVTDANKMLRILPRFHKFCDKWKKKWISRKATNYLSVALKNTINVSQWAGPVLGERTLLLHDTP